MGKVRFQVGEYMLAPLDDARPAAIADFQLRNRDRKVTGTAHNQSQTGGGVPESGQEYHHHGNGHEHSDVQNDV